jgi:hypothetical protein
MVWASASGIGAPAGAGPDPQVYIVAIYGIFLIQKDGRIVEPTLWGGVQSGASLNTESEMTMIPKLRATILGISLGAALLPHAQSVLAQQSATVTDMQETTATIETVDPKTRQVLLHRQDGGYVTMVAGPDVKNFAQIKPGDRVYARYESALVARIGRPDQTLLSDQDIEDEVTAKRGEKPFGQQIFEMRRRVKITAIDPVHHTVSFIGPDGGSRVVVVRKPQMQAFVATLKPGDDVDVSYREANMINVEAAK